MNPRRFFTVFGRDYAFNTRRAMFWVWIFLLVFLSWGLSTGKARIQSGDSSVGGTKSYITSEFAVAQQLMIFTPMIYGFFVAIAAGMSVINDEETRVNSVLHATSLRTREYIWGKFLAVLFVSITVMAIHVGSMILFNHGTPAGEAAEFRGPLILSNYLRPALLFCLPTVIFFAGVSFYVGERSRKPILVFILPLFVLLACNFLLWSFSPSWLDPRLDKLMMLLDPAGFRWMSESLLKVDRGVQFYNNSSVPLDSLIIANRVIVLVLGLGGVLLSQRHFAASLRDRSRKAERTWEKVKATRTVEASPVGQLFAAPTRPLGLLKMTTRRPSLLGGAWHVLKAELVELRSSPGLYLFVPLLVLQAFGSSLMAVGAFDTPLLTTAGTFAIGSFNQLTTLLCIMLLFYTVESLWRDHHTRLAAISLATPIPTGSILIGKALANSLIGVFVLLIEVLIAFVMIAWQKKVGMEFRPFLLIWGLLLVPTLFMWSAFVMVTLSITRNRYATYATALVVLIFTGYRQVIGEINWVGNWPLWSAVQWSDISVLEFDRLALGLNRLLVIGLALLFTALTSKFFPRRDPDPVGIALRLRPGHLIRSGLRLVPFVALPLVAGTFLWAKVDQGFQGDGSKKLMKDYWRKNIATYREWPLPDLTAVDIAVDFEPEKHRLAVEGTYDLINNQEKPLVQIPLSGGLHWEAPTWTFDGKEVKPDNRSGLYLFTPPKPIPKGGTCRIGFKFKGAFPAGITKRGGGNNEFILPSGIVLTSFGTSFAPAIGFNDEVGVDKDNRSETKEYPDDYYQGQTESLFGMRRPYKTKVKLTGPASLTYNSVGTKTVDTIEGDQRTTVWQSDQPVNFYNIVAGNWEVKKGQGTAVYFNPKHPYNIPAMVEGLDAARTYYSKWFWPFPWKELKLSEFPGLATYAQGFPTDITFSEAIGFLTNDDDETSAALTITAHESAHQWWGNIITPGKGPGGNLLSEGTSHFSTMLLLEQLRGPKARLAFARKIEDEYTKTRSSDSERPLVKIDGSRDGDSSVTYNKTGFVLWMLMQHMGRDRMLEGIQAFFKMYHENPDHPVLQDFLAVLRTKAADPAAFDAFTKQWFFEVVVPEYELSQTKKTKDGEAWVITTQIKNTGTGTMPVEIAATRGERFPAKTPGASTSAYQESRARVTLAKGDSKEISIRCDFEPEQVVVDPDLNVLMLRRKSAVARP